MAEIENFTIEKQADSELCWAAAVKSVLDHYMPSAASPTQHQLWTRFGKARDGVRIQSNDAAAVLRQIGALHSVAEFNADPAEKFQYGALGLKISEHIRKKQPIVCCIQGIGSSAAFIHAVVIWKVNELPAPQLYLKDPARPDADVNTSLGDILSGEWAYASLSAYDRLKVYARKFMFTEKPGAVSLMSAGLIESNVRT